MGICIEIEKEFENNESVVYRFGFNLEDECEPFGKFEITKRSQNTILDINDIKRIDENPDILDSIYFRAAIKIFRHCEKDSSGEFPDKLLYAAG